jgi:hypothetical protein
LWQDTIVSEDLAVSIFRLHPEDDGSMVLRNDGDLPQHYTVSEPEDLDLNLHRREGLKSRMIKTDHYAKLQVPNYNVSPIISNQHQ